MSLAKGTIIKGTVGLITAIARTVNDLTNKFASKDERNRKIAENITIVQNTYPIVIGRANGVPLENLVPADRIASNDNRIANQDNQIPQTGRAYEDWLRDE